MIMLRIFEGNMRTFTEAIKVTLRNLTNDIVYEIDCSNCQAIYFGESKLPLKSRPDEHQRSVRNCPCHKNEIAKHC